MQNQQTKELKTYLLSDEDLLEINGGGDSKSIDEDASFMNSLCTWLLNVLGIN